VTGVLQNFNQFSGELGDRLDILNVWLRHNGLPEISRDREYREDSGDRNRRNYLGRVRDRGIELPGVLLPVR
jgi:hypothetical protein